MYPMSFVILLRILHSNCTVFPTIVPVLFPISQILCSLLKHTYTQKNNLVCDSRIIPNKSELHVKVWHCGHVNCRHSFLFSCFSTLVLTFRYILITLCLFPTSTRTRPIFTCTDRDIHEHIETESYTNTYAVDYTYKNIVDVLKYTLYICLFTWLSID